MCCPFVDPVSDQLHIVINPAIFGLLVVFKETDEEGCVDCPDYDLPQPMGDPEVEVMHLWAARKQANEYDLNLIIIVTKSYLAVNNPNISINNFISINVLFHSRPSCVPSSSSGLRQSRAHRLRLVTLLIGWYQHQNIDEKMLSPGYSWNAKGGLRQAWSGNECNECWWVYEF